MTFQEIITDIGEYITPLSAFLIALVAIIEKSKTITAKPMSVFLRWLGNKLNGEISDKIDEINKRQLSQEAYSLNDFYQRHISGENLTREQYELAIAMFEAHIAVGANSVNILHLEVIKDYYKAHFKGE